MTRTTDERPTTRSGQVSGPLRIHRLPGVTTFPVGLDGVTLSTKGYLGAWQMLNRTATIPHAITRMESSGVLSNLRRLVEPDGVDFQGPWFADSDLYKTLEAVGWELSRGADPSMQRFLDQTTQLLARAQDPDGYLNSWFQGTKPDEKWTDLGWSHELYCAGHLIQAAIAVHRTSEDTGLLVVARKLADLLVTTFGPAGVKGICGHPEIETALVELFRETGHRPYLDLAVRMIDLAHS